MAMMKIKNLCYEHGCKCTDVENNPVHGQVDTIPRSVPFHQFPTAAHLLMIGLNFYINYYKGIHNVKVCTHQTSVSNYHLDT